MEDANGDNNEGELTSTMDNVTSVSSKEEKGDTSDATPTSSTDTSHFTASSHIVSDDPISSTSSDTMDQQKSKKNQSDFKSFSADLMDVKDTDNDLLDISHMSGEKITEDVEDLVHDLESLLGEPAPSFVLPSHTRSLAAKESAAAAAAAKDTVDVGQTDKTASEGAKSDTGSTSTKQPEPELAENADTDEVDNVNDDPSGTEEAVDEPGTSKANNEAEIKQIAQDLESPEPQGCDTSTESVAETNQCIQDQDITRSELKEKDDCDNLEATGDPQEALSSESPSEVDTTVVEADQGNVDSVEISAPQSSEEGDPGKVVPETDKPGPARLSPEVQEIEENNVDDAICTVNNTSEDVPEATAAVDKVVLPEELNSPELTEKGNGLDCSQVPEKEHEEIEISPIVHPKTDTVKLNNLENDKVENNSIENPDDSTQCEPEIVKEQSDNEVVTNSKAKNQSNITPQIIENSREKLEVKGGSDVNKSRENEIPVISNECESTKLPSECTQNEATPTEPEEAVECTKVDVPNETVAEPESITKDVKVEEAEESETVAEQVENTEQQETTSEPEALEKTEEIPMEIPNENTEVQLTEHTKVQFVESTVAQSLESTKDKAIENTDLQPVDSTEAQSVEITKVQSVETFEVPSLATVSVTEAECSKHNEDQEVKSDDKHLQLPVSPVAQAPAGSDHLPEPSSIEAEIETNEVLKPEEETVKVSTTQHIDVTPVSVIEEMKDESSTIELEKCVIPVQQTEEIEENEPESSSQLVNDKQTEPDEVALQDEPGVKMSSVIEEVKIDENKMEKSDMLTLDTETLSNKGSEGDEIEEIITDVNEVEDTSEPVVDPLECKGYKEPGPVNLSEESGDDDEVPTLALEPDDEGVQKQNISAKQIGRIKMDLINEVVTTTQFDDVDVQQNLETMRAVASLHGIEVQKQEESPLTEKERIEMEALSKAVESITEPGSDYENKNYVESAASEQLDIQETAFNNDSQEILDETSEQIEQNLQFSVEESEISLKTSENIEKITGLCVETLQTSGITDTLLKVSENVHIPNENVLETPEEAQKVEIINEPKEKESKTKPNERSKRHKKASDNKLEELSINVDVPDKEKPYSPKITIKPIKAPEEDVSTTSNADLELAKGSLKMTITKQSDKMHSIKMGEAETNEPPQEQEEPVPKIKIKSKAQGETPQKMSTRSSRQAASTSAQQSNSPRFHIKPVLKPEKEVSPLKIKIGKSDESTRKHSPKLNIKPIPKPEEEVPKEATHSPRKMMKSQKQAKPEEPEQTPKITIKPIPKPEESPTPTKLTIKPLKKPEETDTEKERSSPKVIIKPIVKPSEPETPNEERIVLKINKGNLPTTKEPKHGQEDEKEEKLAKITLKISKDGGHHIVHPDECPKRPNEDSVTVTEKNKRQKVDVESSIATRSKHKELPESTMETRSRHKEPIPDVTIEFKSNPISPGAKHKDGGPPESNVEMKKIKLRDLKQNVEHTEDEDVKIVEPKVNSPIVISEDSHSQDSSCIIVEDGARGTPMIDLSMEIPKPTPEVSPLQPTPKKRGRPRKVPLEIRPDFKEQPVVAPAPSTPVAAPTESGRPKRSCRSQSALDTLGLKPRKPRGPGRGRGSARGMGTRPIPMKPEKEPKVSKAKLKLMQRAAQAQLKQSRAQEAFFGQVEVAAPQVVPVEEPRDVRIIDTIVIDDDPPSVIEEPVKPVVVETKKERRSLKRGVSRRRSSLQQRESSRRSNALLQESQPPKEKVEENLPLPVESAGVQEEAMLITDSVTLPTAASPKTTNAEVVKDTLNPCQETCRTPEPFEIVMVDEETRMSAETGSRAQTPAKQIVAQTADTIEESQSSVQSTATTESGKLATPRPIKAPRLEVQEPEGAVISADQLTEYFWSGNGPYMLQEQVAQFLGIKSFKRKYPNLKRRVLDMQERDFIKENSLASEHMCDLGLTAVNSVDILDIMYSDFQEKYEEYCKHQRDRQAKELINKQRALTLAASQERNKADILDQAMQSASQWNVSFNKARKDQRRACMDLQTLTVHFPKGKVKKIDKPKVGNYPISLVPGQFTDFYEEFTPTEINNLPINTMCYNEVHRFAPNEESEDSASDGSDTDSDSSTSGTGSSSDSSSGIEDCKLCKHSPKKLTAK